MKELKTKKSAEGPRVRENADVLQHAAKHMLPGGSDGKAGFPAA